MKAQKKAVLRQTETAVNQLHNESYLQTALLSRAREQIGRLLLFENPNWQKLELILRQYVDLKLKGVMR